MFGAWLSTPDYPSYIFSISFVFLKRLLFCVISPVQWSGATSICDGIIFGFWLSFYLSLLFWPLCTSASPEYELDLTTLTLLVGVQGCLFRWQHMYFLYPPGLPVCLFLDAWSRCLNFFFGLSCSLGCLYLRIYDEFIRYDFRGCTLHGLSVHNSVTIKYTLEKTLWSFQF